MEAAYRLLFETLQRFGCVERTLFSSFGHGWLRDLKAQYPVLRTGLLYGGDPKTPEETLELVRAYNADAIHPYLHSINKEIGRYLPGARHRCQRLDGGFAGGHRAGGILWGDRHHHERARPGAGLLRGACVMGNGMCPSLLRRWEGQDDRGHGLALRAGRTGVCGGGRPVSQGRQLGGMPALAGAGRSHAIPVSSRGALHLCMTPEQRGEAARFYAELLGLIEQRRELDLVVLDEVLDAVGTGLLEETALLSYLRNRPEGQEVVLTGRNPSARLRDAAEYITDMRAVKHPYVSGQSARRGVEW